MLGVSFLDGSQQVRARWLEGSCMEFGGQIGIVFKQSTGLCEKLRPSAAQPHLIQDSQRREA
jgi:hypothetical protein